MGRRQRTSNITACRRCDHAGILRLPRSATRPAGCLRRPKAPPLRLFLIFQVLSRTPVKSVCRFRCVSRSWRALVSDEVFVAAHESRTEPHLLLIANSSNKERGSQGRDLRLLDMHGNIVKVIKKVGFYSAFCPSFDDAICVTFDDRGNTNLVDLATGKVILTQTWSSLHDGSSCGFGFRCAMQSYSLGLGRAIPSGLYKAVRFITHAVNGHLQQTCEVRTLVADSTGWRRTESHAPIHVRGRFATTVNGVLHFLRRLMDGVYVLRFNLESEEWKRAIKGPLEADDYKSLKITQLNGTLCMIKPQPRVHGHTGIDIWLMSDYDQEIWTKAYTISTALGLNSMIPLRVIRGKLLVSCYRNYGMETTLKIYDPCTKTFTFAMEMPYTTVGVVGICSLHLKGFWLP
ncbi:hypothetical protein ACQ4PT_005204 [Festuca glaucescens]